MSDHEDVEHLRAERDALEQRVESLEARPQRRRRTARIVATVLTVLAVLVFAVAVPGLWARRTLLNTDRYVATAAPLAQDPAVQEYLARTVTQQVFDALDVQTRLADVLQERDPRLAFLAGPISNGVEGFVQDQLLKVFASDAFATAWEQANRFVHAQLIAALEGGGETVQVQNGAVVLNLLPLVNQGLAAISGVVTDLVGHPVSLPEITGDEIPSEAITKLESALGIDLPDNFGTVTVYDSDELAAVQQGVDLASRAIVALAVLFLILAAVAVWVSPRKRRTLLQLATALAVVLVIERRFAIAEGNAIVDKVKPENQAAGRAVVDQVIGSLLRYTGLVPRRRDRGAARGARDRPVPVGRETPSMGVRRGGGSDRSGARTRAQRGGDVGRCPPRRPHDGRRGPRRVDPPHRRSVRGRVPRVRHRGRPVRARGVSGGLGPHGAGRSRRLSSPTKGDIVFKTLLVAFVVFLFATFPATWLLMLFLGNVGVNTSYWGTLPLGILVSTLLAGSSAARSYR